MNQAVIDAEAIICRWICTKRPGQTPPPFVRRALKFVERKAAAAKPSVARQYFDFACKARDELMERGKGYQKRAAVRRSLADYIEKKIFCETHEYRFVKVAERLRQARLTGTWGTRPNGDVVTIWDDKSGLLRLDPDEAREETQRLADRYIPELVRRCEQGAGVHYAVFTLPNFAPGKLAHGQAAIFRRYVNLLRKRADKVKLFPEILGSIAVCESPLAADQTWNVHINVFLLTRRRFEPNLYKKLRQAWHWNVEIKPIKGEHGHLARAFNELIKYTTRAVPEKSADKAARRDSPAPAMTDWPSALFVEWFDAQHRFRRTRTYGALYGGKVPKPAAPGLDDVTWHGAVRCDPDRFFAQLPLIDLIPGDKSTTRRTLKRQTGPP